PALDDDVHATAPLRLTTEIERPTVRVVPGGVVCCLPFCHRYPFPTPRHRERGRHPSGRPGLRPHIRLLRISQLCCHYCPSLLTGDIWTPGEAGLTPKPHRDQSTKSRFTWAVSPAAGIG